MKNDNIENLKKELKGIQDKVNALVNSASDSLGENDTFFIKLNSINNDIGDLLDYKGESVNESDDAEESWFHKIGSGTYEIYPPNWAIEKFNMMQDEEDQCIFPKECIDDCSHGGSVDNDVDYWVDELDFMKGFPVDAAKRTLEEYGIGDDVGDNPRELAKYILWIACGDIRDGQETFYLGTI